jgi:hypothetical protein
MDNLLTHITTGGDAVSAIAYADDLVILLQGESRKELESLGMRAIEKTNTWCKLNKMEIAVQKTTMLMLKGVLQRDPIIKLNNQSIKRSKTAKYLGVQLDKKLNFATHIEDMCNRSIKTMHNILSLSSRQYKIPLNIAQIYLSGVFSAIIGYSASVWAHRLLSVMPRLAVRRAHRGVLVRFVGAFASTSYEALAIVTDTLPIDYQIRQRAAIYWLRKGNQERVANVLGRQANTNRQIKQIIKSLWEEEWLASVKGARPRSFFPTLQHRQDMIHIVPTQGMVHYLTGHGPYPAHLLKLNLRDNDTCSCGEQGTPEHIVLRCATGDPIAIQLRLELENMDTIEILRDMNKAEILNKLANRISQLEYQKYTARH